jgi:hypothetical protein
MDEKIVQEILHELFSSLETLDTQSTAILQLLKDKGLADDKEIAAHLEQAGNASSVRWRAVRARIDYLVAGAIKAAEQDAKRPEPPKTTGNIEETKPATEPAVEKDNAKSAKQLTPEIAKPDGGKSDPPPVEARKNEVRDKDANQPVGQNQVSKDQVSKDQVSKDHVSKDQVSKDQR